MMSRSIHGSFAVVFFIFCSMVKGQTVHSFEDAPQIGQQLSMTVGTWVEQNAVGVNAVWDYSTSATGSEFDISFVDATTAPNAEDFPEATLVVEFGTTRSYMSTDETGLYDHGNTQFFSVTEYVNPFLQIPYPLELGTTWESSYAGFTGSIYFSGDSEGQAVGIGTLELPWGSIENVIRVQLVVDGYYFSTPQEGRQDTVDVYYKSGYPWYLLRATKRWRILNGQVQPLQYSMLYATQESVVGIGEGWTTQIGAEVYPNPTTGSTTLVLTSDGSAADLWIIDMNGKLISETTLPSSAGGIRTTQLDFSDRTPGLYSVMIRDQRGSIGRARVLVE